MKKIYNLLNLEILVDKLYTETDSEIRKYIPDKLAKLGDWGSTKHLGKILLDSNESAALRSECAESLGKQGDPQAVPYLEIAVSTEINELRRTIIWSFGQIGVPEVVPILLKFTMDQNVMVRRWVAKSLGRVRGYNVHIHLINFTNSIVKTDLHVRADIIRAVVDQISSLPQEAEQFWFTQCITNLYEESATHITLSSAILLEMLVMKSFTQNISDIRRLYEKFKDNIIVRPYLLNCLGILKELKPVIGNEISAELLQALSLMDHYDLHQKVIASPGIYPAKILEKALDTIDSVYVENEREFFSHLDLGVRIAALKIHALKGNDSVALFQEIKNYKLSYGVLKLFCLYPDSTLNVLMDAIKSDDKVMRQIALRTIIQVSFLNKFRKQVISTVLLIARKDKVWHIRRDARIFLSEIKI